MPTAGTVHFNAPGQAEMVATCEGKSSNSCIVTVGGTPPPPPSGYPNCPAGLTTLFDYAGDVLPPAVGQWISLGAGKGYIGWFNGSPTYQHIITVSDDTAWMQSPAQALRYTIPEGFTGDGQSTGIIAWWRSSADGVGVREFYFGWRMRIFGDGVDFDHHSVLSKLFYMSYGPTSRNNQSIVGFNGSGVMASGTLSLSASEMNDDGSDAGHAAGRLWSNVPGAPAVQVGPHGGGLLELYVKMNTFSGPSNGGANPPNRDGVFKMWWKGQMTHWIGGGSPYPLQREYATAYVGPGLRYSSYENPCGVRQLHYDPVWGGRQTATKTQSDSYDTDHAYGAGR